MRFRFEIFILIRNKQVNTLTKEIGKKYKTYRVLKYTQGPHISFIYLNEKLKENEINDLIHKYKGRLRKIKPFYLNVNGISFFRKHYGKSSLHYTVILKIIPDKNLIRLNHILKNEVKDINHLVFSRFQPHISIARPDLDKEKFYRIMKNYKGHKIKFRVWLTCIYAATKRNKKQKWKLVKIKLGSK